MPLFDSAIFDTAIFDTVAGGTNATANGATLTYTLSLIPGAASGGAAMDATANGVTLTYSTALIAGSASAASQAAGATLTETLSLIAGAAQAASQAQGATLTTTQSLIAGAAQADSQAAGQTLAVTYSLLPGAASGGVSATANGATLSYAYSLLAGIASGDVVVTRRGDDGGWRPDVDARKRFWAKKAEDWLEAKLEQLPKLAKKAKAKRATAIETYEDDAADYLEQFPEYAPRINAVSALMDSLAQPYTDYAALMRAIEVQQALIEAHKRARRRARDIEAILLLDA